MRRVTETEITREACLRRSLDYEWAAENSPNPKGAVEAWDKARSWRSLALVAKPGAPALTNPETPA
jgi:hypothetical protein